MPLARKTVTGTSCLRTCSRKVSWRACGCAAAMIGFPGRPHTRWPTIPLSAHRLAVRSCRTSALAQQDHVGAGAVLTLGRYGLAEEGGGDIPLPPIIGDDRHGLLVVACQHTLDRPMPRGLEADPIPNLELQHLHMGSHLLEKAQARNDAVVEVDELGLAQPVNVDLHAAPFPQGWRRWMVTNILSSGLGGTEPSKEPGRR